MEKASKQLCFVLLLLVCISAYSQERKPLTEIISVLQKIHTIQFNYADDLIDSFQLIPPSTESSLDAALLYLERQTGLLFSKMNDHLVLVKQKDTLFLCGYLKDIDTQNPLVSATVQSGKNYAVTDENGFFHLKIESEVERINIRFLGYKTITKPYKEFAINNCAAIYMFPKLQALSEVLLSNYITPGINKINDGSFVIDFSRFGILPGVIDNDVLLAVQAFPGIQSINETVSDINIRGGTHDQNLILWDGIKMYQSGHFFGLISIYNPQITQKVSVRKNGTDVTYTDGVSGTIAMHTSDSLNQKFNANVGLNLIDVNAFADIPIGQKSSVQIAGRKSISNFIKTPTYNEFFERISQNTEVQSNLGNTTNSDKKFDFYDTSLRWIYKISDTDELRINFINVSNELQFNENIGVGNGLKSRESSLSQNSIAGAVYYHHIWNPRFQTSFEGYETDYKLKAINANVQDAQRFKQENVVSETSLKLKMEYQFNEGFQFLNGYHFVETEVTNLDDVDFPLFRFLVSEVMRTHSVFSQIGYKSTNNKTVVNTGVRFNYIEKFNQQIWEPRLSFTQRFLEYFTFEVLGEFKNQNTSQIINFQNDFLGIEKRRWQLSNNNDIPIIKSKQLSTGITFSQKGWLASVEGYYKNVVGITAQSQGFQNQYEFVKSSGSYKANGVDVLLRKNISILNFWLSYSYMDNKYTFDELEEASFPSNLDINHAITLGASYSAKNLKVSTGLNWHTGKPTTPPLDGNDIANNEINYAPTNSKNLKDYMRMDISALYNFELGQKAKAEFGVSIWNVLNKENQINSFYRLDNQMIVETDQRSLGITPNAVLRVYF